MTILREKEAIAANIKNVTVRYTDVDATIPANNEDSEKTDINTTRLLLTKDSLGLLKFLSMLRQLEP